MDIGLSKLFKGKRMNINNEQKSWPKSPFRQLSHILQIYVSISSYSLKRLTESQMFSVHLHETYFVYISKSSGKKLNPLLMNKLPLSVVTDLLGSRTFTPSSM